MSLLTFGVAALGGQAAGVAVQASDVASPVSVGRHLAQWVVLEAFYAAVGVFDTQHFALGGALKLGGLAQGIGDGDQVLAVVVAIGSDLAGAILIAGELGKGVPAQGLGFVQWVGNGVGQAVVASGDA